jgi:hypothetical protein
MASAFSQAANQFLAEIRNSATAASKDLARQIVEDIQAEAVARVPRRTGNLAQVLASPEMIIERNRGGFPASIVYVYAFTPATYRRGYYAYFVEYGTKGYSAGERRRAGKTATGYQKWKKVRRNIPAHPAQPFLRPAVRAVMQRYFGDGTAEDFIAKRVKTSLRGVPEVRQSLGVLNLIFPAPDLAAMEAAYAAISVAAFDTPFDGARGYSATAVPYEMTGSGDIMENILEPSSAQLDRYGSLTMTSRRVPWETVYATSTADQAPWAATNWNAGR